MDPLFPSILIEPSHKSHNASDQYLTMYHFVAELCTLVKKSVTKWCTLRIVQHWVCAADLLYILCWSAFNFLTKSYIETAQGLVYPML